jgi:hypothetical protein
MAMPIAGGVGTILLCAAGIAAAQGVTWESEGCVDAARTAPAAQCALLIVGDELFRGAPAATVSAGQLLSPIPLSRFVRGDSARRYALAYERQSRTSRLLRLVGGGAMFFTSVAGVSSGAKVQRADARTNRMTAAVMISGMTVLAASVPFRWLAERNAERAVGAHNRTLARQ